MKKGHLVSSLALGSILAVFLWNGGAPARTVEGTDYRELDRLAEVLQLVRQSYVKEVDDRQLIEGALRGMLSTLDPHTSYLSEQLFSEMQQETRGEFEGLGIEITKRRPGAGGDSEGGAEGFVTVVSPIDETPAARAGLKAQDQIIEVCPDATADSCKSTQDMELQEAVKMMRGKRGTEILIRVMRKGWDLPRPFVIRRESIKVPPGQMFVIEKGLVYLRLAQFTESAETFVSDSLNAARKQIGGEITGLVFDLRDNPGGLLEQAVKVADLFLDEGVIVSSEGRNGSGRSEWKATRDKTEGSYPIVVLVNGGSASASEIVAGALQDRERAFLVGNETFGKGSVQTIIPLDGGKAGLRLTTQLYYLPSGRSIQEVRVQPDLVVDPFTEEMVAALEKAERPKSFGEVDLERHLSGPKAGSPKSSLEPRTPQEPAVKPTGPTAPKAPATAPAEVKPEEPPLTKEEAFRRALQIDRQLTQGVALLKSAPIFSKVLGGKRRPS
jgi:carboxyl-terminal processing protease